MTETVAPAEKYAWAVDFMRRIETLRASIGRLFARNHSWPPLPGDYCVADPAAPVAICTLGDAALMKAVAAFTGVAIAGRVFTANLGSERIVLDLTANPNVRFLLLCGRDSPLFKPGQTLKALLVNGLSPDRRVIGAEGYLPQLASAAAAQVARFREQLEVVDLIGEEDQDVLKSVVGGLVARSPGPLAGASAAADELPKFQEIRVGGHREPIAYDPKGFFVVSLDREHNRIVVHHYRKDNSPAHLIQGRSPEAIMLGLLRENLVSQLSHAAYLGGELAKAEAALRLGLKFEQDRQLRSKLQEQRDETHST